MFKHTLTLIGFSVFQ